jgi:hypothetical protein
MSETSIIHSLNISSAPLPVAYENAKMAIYQCNELDECKDWSDKAQALASYARQSADEELEKMSKRIRARAIRRCGELLKLFDGKGNNQHKDGSDHKLSKSEVGESVGLSERQIKQANRLSNIPEDDFNRQVESNNVPTLTALAKQGIKPLTEQQIKNREWLSKPKPEGFADAIHTIGMMKELKYYTDKFEPEYILGGMDEDGKKKAIEIIKSLESWFDRFVVKM